jgi:type IV pilus assembly protein PilM
MPAPKAVWAVDIGQCALKALHVKMAGEEIEIDQFVILPHEQILSQPDADEPALIRKTLQKFSAQFPQIKDPLIISVPGHRSFARFSKLPPVEPKKIPDIVHYEATQQIPFGIDEVVWDYHIFQAQGSPEVEVGIFAIKKSIISQYLGYFHELNLNPIVVQTAPIALYNAFCYEGLVGKQATVIADVGAQNTNFLIAEDFRLWLRNIPLGGNNFTETLQKAFKLNFTKAEELKCTAATSKYARAVFQAMRPVFSDLSSEFQRSIGFYTSVNREAQVSELYSMGSAFRLPGLLKFLQQNLGMPIKKLETFGKARLAGSINEANFSENVLTLGVAYGLALQGLGLAKVNTDLMPVEIARQVVWKKKEYWFVGAAACLVLAGAMVWLRVASDSSAIQADKDQNLPAIEQVVQKYSKFKTDYQKYSNPDQLKSKLVLNLQQMSKEKLVMPELLAVLTGAVPTPQKELAEARTLEEYKKAAKKIARTTRNQIFVKSLQVSYVPNLTKSAIEALSQAGAGSSLRTLSKPGTPGGMGGMGGMGAGPGYAPGMTGPPGAMGPGGGGMGPPSGMGGMGGMGGSQMGPPGGAMGRRSGSGAGSSGRPVEEAEPGIKAFMVAIEGTTPHAEAPEFLINNLVKSLQGYGKTYATKNKMPFYIDHVKVGNCQPLVPPEKRSLPELQNQPTETQNNENVPRDPLTGESLVHDSSFVVTCVAFLRTPATEGPEEGSEKASNVSAQPKGSGPRRTQTR